MGKASCSPFLQPDFAIFRYPIADEPKTPCPVSDLTLLNSIPNSFQTHSRTECINHTLAIINYNGSKIKHTLWGRTATCHKRENTSPRVPATLRLCVLQDLVSFSRAIQWHLETGIFATVVSSVAVRSKRSNSPWKVTNKHCRLSYFTIYFKKISLRLTWILSYWILKQNRQFLTSTHIISPRRFNFRNSKGKKKINVFHPLNKYTNVFVFDTYDGYAI